jgi:hypothetical protein
MTVSINDSFQVLSNASDYWVSVINAGRAFQLSAVLAAVEGAEHAGQVISALMHVADVLATAGPGAEAAAAEGGCLVGTAAQIPLHELAAGYLRGGQP